MAFFAEQGDGEVVEGGGQVCCYRGEDWFERVNDEGL